MSKTVGIDGCKGGWITVSQAGGNLLWGKFTTLSTFFSQTLPDVVAIDIPIGLLENGSRSCDLIARRLLGKRRSSVFPAPLKALLRAEDYRNACDIQTAIDGKKITRQAWGILPKVAEVYFLLQERSELSTVLYEVHPEVSFYFMNGNKPNEYGKKKKQGIDERIKILLDHFEINGTYINDMSKCHRTKKDDIVDALAALWTAKRIFSKDHIVLPAERNANEPRITA